MPQPEQKGGEAVRAVYSDSGAFLTHTSWQKKEGDPKPIVRGIYLLLPVAPRPSSSNQALRSDWLSEP